MTDAVTDLQADALLLVVIEQEGDLRRAFAALCARVSPEDLAGESFERALARAVRALFSQPHHALAGLSRPAVEQGPANDV